MPGLCQEHKKSLEFICTECNNLLCGRCLAKHNRNHPDHLDYFDHIDDIKQTLTNFQLQLVNNNNNNNHSNGNTIDGFKSLDHLNINFKTIESIWESLKSNISILNKLLSTENDIEQYFHQLHEYLRMKQNQLIKPIIDKKEIITNKLESNLENLKQLITILNVNHNSNNNNNNNKKKYKKQSKSLILDNNNYMDIYSLKSINEYESLASFITNNNQKLFENYQNINLLVKQYSDPNSLILDLILKYNIKFNNKSLLYPDINDSEIDYKIIVKTVDFKLLNSIVEQTIKVESLKPELDVSVVTLPETTPVINQPIQSYIFASHIKKGASLINTNDNSIERLKINYSFNDTFHSMVSIGEYIYVFGGLVDRNRWMKYSVKTRSIDHIGYIDGTNSANSEYSISACYDGLDHIYLVNGSHLINNRIDRLNIKTMQLERYHHPPKQYGRRVSSMIYNGSLFTILFHQNIMVEFNLKDKTTVEYQFGIIAFTACHDNNGNFYIHSKRDEFIRFNVLNKQITKLNSIPGEDGFVFIQYQSISPTESYIYSFGGVDNGNFKYSIESNQSQPFFEGDKYSRSWCGSVSISF